MIKYNLKKIILKNGCNLPIEIIDYISRYLDFIYVLDSIKNKDYVVNGFWFKRIVNYKIIDISRDDISYFDWYKIFHNKDYSMLIKYENTLITKLLKTKTKEYIENLHKQNLLNCHIKNFMNYKFNC
jgi:hypothetical protein|tara:strand:+ start:295 stop:675 length:381 start_codon:yes stop_codon:yes gene_type:complete